MTSIVQQGVTHETATPVWSDAQRANLQPGNNWRIYHGRGELLNPVPFHSSGPATPNRNVEFQGDDETIRDTPNLQNLDRATRYYHGDFVANYHPPDRAELRHGPDRPGVIQMNWAGLHTADTWQNFHAAEAHKSVRDYSTSKTLATRLWAIDIRARTPIPFSRYVIDPTQLMQGNYRATNPQGR